jgi:hypothetical protein
MLGTLLVVRVAFLFVREPAIETMTTIRSKTKPAAGTSRPYLPQRPLPGVL